LLGSTFDLGIFIFKMSSV